MKPIIFAPSARDDLAAIRDYISPDDPGAAERFIGMISEQCERLARMPGIGRPRDVLRAGLRSIVVSHYVILYRETPDRVEIVRVVSGYRDMDALFDT